MMRTFNNRALFWALLVLVAFRLSRSVSRIYSAQTDFNDVLFHENLLAVYDAYSLIMCSAVCGPRCAYFGVNLQNKKCRVHTGCQSRNSTLPEVGWRYYSPETEGTNYPMDCKTLFSDGHTMSSVYTIYPWNNRSVRVYCDMNTKGRGWTVIQRRVRGAIDFNRTWNEYKHGFGCAYSSYWLGNDVIHLLTNHRPSLYVSITLTNERTLYEQYEEFSINSELDQYRLHLAGPTEGTLGDSMLNTGLPYNADLSGMNFSTADRDNDRCGCNCAASYGGGWWFIWCHHAFLNGPWYPGFWSNPWNPTLDNGNEIKETIMMIKPH